MPQTYAISQAAKQKKHKNAKQVVKVLIIKLMVWWKSLFNLLMIINFIFESFAEIYIYGAFLWVFKVALSVGGSLKVPYNNLNMCLIKTFQMIKLYRTINHLTGFIKFHKDISIAHIEKP